MDFKDFKKNKKKILEKTKKLMKPTNYSDDRFWVPSKDEAGNGGALIRFLPQKDVEKNPFVLNFQHFFKEKGKWFIEKCPCTWDKNCPICSYVEPFWDGSKKEKEIAGKYGRKRQYIANVLVIKDPSKPENDGGVFLYKFGKKIFDKIINKISPNSELDTEVIVYDLWEGMDFKLKIKKVYGYPNYDDSEFFGMESPIKDSDKEIEKIYNSIYDLGEFLDEKNCKSEIALSKKFFTAIGKSNNVVIEKQEEVVKEEEEEIVDEKLPFDDEEEKTEENVVEETNDTKETDESTDDEDWDWDA